MKIDMHCHVREGSIDSKVPIEEFIKKLQSKGIGGMLVTDHDTYNGYRHWKNTIKGRKYKDFVVLKGIEYDTLDAALPDFSVRIFLQNMGISRFFWNRGHR